MEAKKVICHAICHLEAHKSTQCYDAFYTQSLLFSFSSPTRLYVYTMTR